VTGLSKTRTRLALLALALGGFGIGCTEFVAMGLLPDLASDLLPRLYAVSPAQANAHAGWLISAYALGVVVGAPTIAALAARLPRKKLLLWLLVAFTLGTAASALAPTFGLVLLARFLCGLPHGAYFGIASLVAASLMGPGKRGQGVAFVLSGLAIANVIGVPLITWLGQLHGWRVAYLAVAAIFALTFAAIALFVPWQQGNPESTMRRELRAFTRLQVWLTLGIGAIGFGGFFAVYTYIAPVATTVTGIIPAAVPLVLVLVGLGMTIGNIVGGIAADKDLKRYMLVFFGVLFVGLIGLFLTAHSVAGLLIFLFLIAAACSALSPSIQTRLMDVAHDSQSIAAALNHSALNVANASGAFLGSLAIAAGFGYLSPSLVGAILCLFGILIAVASFTVDRRRARKRAVSIQPLSTDTAEVSL
jgi:MFS transporter, DHA1 family, inner membrane transport protein